MGDFFSVASKEDFKEKNSSNERWSR